MLRQPAAGRGLDPRGQAHRHRVHPGRARHLRRPLRLGGPPGPGARAGRARRAARPGRPGLGRGAAHGSGSHGRPRRGPALGLPGRGRPPAARARQPGARGRPVHPGLLPGALGRPVPGWRTDPAGAEPVPGDLRADGRRSRLRHHGLGHGPQLPRAVRPLLGRRPRLRLHPGPRARGAPAGAGLPARLGRALPGLPVGAEAPRRRPGLRRGLPQLRHGLVAPGRGDADHRARAGLDRRPARAGR